MWLWPSLLGKVSWCPSGSFTSNPSFPKVTEICGGREGVGRQEAPGMGQGGSRWLRQCQHVSRPGGPTLWALPLTPSSGAFPL